VFSAGYVIAQGSAVGYGATLHEAQQNAHFIARNACPLGGYITLSVTSKQVTGGYMYIIVYRCANQGN